MEYVTNPWAQSHPTSWLPQKMLSAPPSPLGNQPAYQWRRQGWRDRGMDGQGVDACMNGHTDGWKGAWEGGREGMDEWML